MSSRPPRISRGTHRVLLLRITTVIGLLVLLAAVGLALAQPMRVLGPPIALALLVVYLLDPFVRLLGRRGVPRVAGTALAYLIAVVVLAVSLAVLVPMVTRYVDLLAERIPQVLLDLQTKTNELLGDLGVPRKVELIGGTSGVQDAIRGYAFIGGRLNELLSRAGSVGAGAAHLVAITLLGPVVAFYLLADLPRVLASLRRLIPPDHRDEVTALAHLLSTRVGGYFQGQLVLSALVGVGQAIGLALIGLPLWGLIGVVSGLLNLVPALGGFATGALCAVAALALGKGMTQALLAIGITLLVRLINGHVLVPYVMWEAVDLHPIIVMLGLLAFGAVFGVVGFLVAVPVLSAIKVVSLHVLSKVLPWAVEEGPLASEGAGEAAAG